MAYQNETNKKKQSEPVIVRNSIYKVKYCQSPDSTNAECKNYVSLCSTDQVKFRSADDTVWSVLKLF